MESSILLVTKLIKKLNKYFKKLNDKKYRYET